MTQRPWLASYGNVPAQINADAYGSIVELLEQAMAATPTRRPSARSARRLSFAEVDRLSARFASYLQRELRRRQGRPRRGHDAQPGGLPGGLLRHRRAWAVQVNVNPLYTPGNWPTNSTMPACKTIVVFNGSTPTLAEVIDQTRAGAHHHRQPWRWPGRTALPAPRLDARLTGALPLADILREGKPTDYSAPAITGDDLLFLQYTGGTTGVSKGACLSHRNLVANTEQFKALMGDSMRPGEEVIVTALPLYHIFALMVNLISYFSLGAENWLVANPRDMDGLIQTFKESKTDGVHRREHAVLRAWPRIPELKEVDWSNLRLSVGGGAAVIPATSARWQEVTGS